MQTSGGLGGVGGRGKGGGGAIMSHTWTTHEDLPEVLREKAAAVSA